MKSFIFLLAFCFSTLGFAQSNTPIGIKQLAAINLTAAGTAQAISSTDLWVHCVAIQALAANTGVIYVGDSAVAAANGYVLQKGDTLTLCAATPSYKVNLKNIYIDGGTTNDDIKVSYSSGIIGHVPKPL